MLNLVSQQATWLAPRPLLPHGGLPGGEHIPLLNEYQPHIMLFTAWDLSVEFNPGSHNTHHMISQHAEYIPANTLHYMTSTMYTLSSLYLYVDGFFIRQRWLRLRDTSSSSAQETREECKLHTASNAIQSNCTNWLTGLTLLQSKVARTLKNAVLHMTESWAETS